MSFINSECVMESICGCRESITSSMYSKQARIVLYLCGAAIFTAGLILPLQGWQEFLVFVTAYVIFGGGVLLRAARNIAGGRVFDENFLMSIATLGAFAIGEYPEGVAVMVFYRIGEMLQDHAVNRSRSSIEKLIDIRPDYAHLIEGSGTRKVSPEEVKVGDVIMVRPGERVPLDGRVLKGTSNLDVSALTGESLPHEVAPGDDVLSGSVNQAGLLDIEVSRVYKESTVNRILSLVEGASARKAQTEKFISRFAAYYTPLVVAAALLIAFIPPMVMPGEELSAWVYRSLVFLVISCPCALVISIPLGFFGGIGGASRKGILVKGANYLEALSAVDTVIFDKTGTLTRGAFKVKGVYPTGGFSKEELLRYGAAAAYYSSHPVSYSILQAGKEGIVEKNLHHYYEMPGHGVQVTYDNKEIIMGNNRLMRKCHIRVNGYDGYNSRVHLAVAGIYAGSIAVADQLNDDAPEAVRRLRELGVKNIYMLSGDKQQVAEEVGNKLKLDRVYAGLLPDQKVEIIEQLERENKTGKKHVFVGDGINDAPSLARAEIGVAMGGVGSDAAIEAADVVLMTGQPSKLAEAIVVARKTKSIVVQNIILALGIKAVIMTLGLFAMATMWEAVFADVGVALLAVINAMRAMK